MKKSTRTLAALLALGLPACAQAQLARSGVAAGFVSGIPATLLSPLGTPGLTNALGNLPVQQTSLGINSVLTVSPSLIPGTRTLPKAPGAAIQAAPARKSLTAAVSAIEGAKGPSASESRRATLQTLFEGGPMSLGVAEPEDFRPPDYWEDARINAALRGLSRSPVGLSVYRDVYQKYGSRLTIKIDDDRNASYDARMTREGGRPVLYLTESLVDNASPEATAAFIARELADVYYEDFPVSAERGYLSYGVMVRTFAELTDSDLASNGYAWDTSRDRRSGGTYVLQRYYGSWKEAAQGSYSGRDVRNSAFFRFLRTSDDSNTEPRSKMSLLEQYNNGHISYSTYRQMRDYFDGIVRSEVDWLSGSGRW